MLHYITFIQTNINLWLQRSIFWMEWKRCQLETIHLAEIFGKSKSFQMNSCKNRQFWGQMSAKLKLMNFYFEFDDSLIARIGWKKWTFKLGESRKIYKYNFWEIFGNPSEERKHQKLEFLAVNTIFNNFRMQIWECTLLINEKIRWICVTCGFLGNM